MLTLSSMENLIVQFFLHKPNKHCIISQGHVQNPCTIKGNNLCHNMYVGTIWYATIFDEIKGKFFPIVK